MVACGSIGFGLWVGGGDDTGLGFVGVLLGVPYLAFFLPAFLCAVRSRASEGYELLVVAWVLLACTFLGGPFLLLGGVLSMFPV